jgi:hypothetical protein
MNHGITPTVEASYFFADTPSVWSLRPGVTWYLPIRALRPWIGVHYTRWFVGEDLPDENAVGGRLGISLGRVLSIGVVYDRLLDCDRDCDAWTPQISAGLAF